MHCKKRNNQEQKIVFSVVLTLLLLLPNTAIGNDYGFDQIFVRQIEALANPNDAVVGISTSGKSTNVIKAIEKAKLRADEITQKLKT